MKRPLILAAACLLFPLIAQAELVDNPAYQHWAKYKAGTFTTYKMTMEVPGMPAGMAGQSHTLTNKLVEITPEKATVETSMAMGIPGAPNRSSKQVIPAKIEKEKVEDADFKSNNPQAKDIKVKDIKTGTDKVDVKGETLDTVTREATIESSQEGETMVAKTKVWTTDKVPGGLVKMETNAEKPMTMKTSMILGDYHVEK